MSNSDAHSPARIGREANIFRCRPGYAPILEAIRDPSRGFAGTVEFFPEEGKYHFDGHRACGVCMSPEETIGNGGLCPVCERPLTVGVLHRIVELADRPEGHVPPGALPCVHLVPLQEIIAESLGVRSITARVKREYRRLLALGGTEMDILLWHGREALEAFLPERLLRGILRMREGRVGVRPGHDGVYGVISVLGRKGAEEKTGGGKRQGKKGRHAQLELF